MLEILQNFEQTATRLSPIVLIGLGLMAVLAGLFVWLGGLGFRRILVAVIGAAGGGICGFLITGRNAMWALVLAAAVCVIAILFEKMFITVMAAGLAAAFGFAVLAGPYITQARQAIPINAGQTQNHNQQLSIDETTEIIKTEVDDFSDKIKQASLQMPAHNWAIIVVLVVIFILAGFFLWRLTSAFYCAALGTTLIFVGMILLLLCKGAVPVTRISDKPSVYAAAFIGMTAFGTIEQLLLCQTKKKQSTTKKEPDKDKEN